MGGGEVLKFSGEEKGRSLVEKGEMGRGKKNFANFDTKFPIQIMSIGRWGDHKMSIYEKWNFYVIFQIINRVVRDILKKSSY